MVIFRKAGKAVFRSIPIDTVKTNFLEIFEYDKGKRLKSSFEKNLTWKVFSNRIETTDRFRVKSVLRIAIDRDESGLGFTTYKIHPEDAIDAQIGAITIKGSKIVTAYSADEKEIQVFSTKKISQI